MALISNTLFQEVSFSCENSHEEGTFFMFIRLLEEYLLDLKLQNYSKRTIETYRQHNIKFFDFFTEKISTNLEVSQVSKIHFKLFISSLLDKNLKSSYINAILKSNKVFWNYLFTEELITKSPLDGIRLLKETKRILVTFNDDEIKKMLNVWKYDNYLSVRNKCIIAMLTDTGIRVSELINIKDSDLADNYLKVLGKGEKWRVVPLSNELNYFITRYRRIRDIHYKNLRNRNNKSRCLDPNLFLGKTGKAIKSVATIEQMISKTGELAGVRDSLRCSPHDFRHYWTVKNLQQGQDLFTISKMLGHSKLDTTKIYISSITDEQLVNKAVKTSPLNDIL